MSAKRRKRAKAPDPNYYFDRSYFHDFVFRIYGESDIANWRWSYDKDMNLILSPDENSPNGIWFLASLMYRCGFKRRRIAAMATRMRAIARRGLSDKETMARFVAYKMTGGAL